MDVGVKKTYKTKKIMTFNISGSGIALNTSQLKSVVDKKDVINNVNSYTSVEVNLGRGS